MGTCRHCGYENPNLTTCPLCGTTAAAASSTMAPIPTQEAMPAWENPSVAFPRSLVDTWCRSVLEPGRFFRGVPYEQAAARPILYYLIVGVLSSFFWLWWTAVLSRVEIPFLAGLGGFSNPVSESGAAGGSVAGSALFTFFIAPFSAIISLIVWSMLLHLFVLMLGRRRRNLTATVRVISYAAGPSILGVVPVLGWMVGLVWSMVLTVVGVREAHRMSTGMAAGVVLLALVVPFLVFVVLVVVMVVAATAVFGA